VIGHNHPSGKALPSDPDLLLTLKLEQSATILGIKLLDHIIVSPSGDHYSFFDPKNQDNLKMMINNLSLQLMLNKAVSNPNNH
jgi:hypothetical protein